ncbi:dephospho-CoA kinase (dephosphocoenzyme A kinase) [Oceanobacillus iheyensis HTE831]|uniref:Dephospho-CoA kinase n=1 Tax=Oceanobacillus iheyensis (strain DSM 14371 / CIP 107618 / JCM 11309 / KCTC 3954 / HTE831) TaxID=221109 RepID=COAE_OCEIH|nr:dephospho-CoA kinase [Oceanobacillus iheyensis]Q8EPE7.1 RecName: Full=Dephospho-CoA kinase; AltName: Full=Dephosphocoenzyme A kinase [Oceanobacillus iheyensis HTE831]BAC14117.1 dephospho-CoA kinase (dephosphocoenzyme A kinase) [Oceanobacillus iheyensis HTE831]
MTLVIGLTGGIASGKSTVSSMLLEKNFPVIDADLIAREVVEPGEKAYDQILEAFGKEIIQNDQKIDRPKLGSIIFTDEDKRKQLNAIVHPAVRNRMLTKRDDYINNDVPCVILDIPLLFESNLGYLVDKTLVVYVDEDIQLTRLMKRNEYSEKEALDRIKAQMSLKEKADLADIVIDNNQSVEETKLQLDNVLQKWNIS